MNTQPLRQHNLDTIGARCAEKFSTIIMCHCREFVPKSLLVNAWDPWSMVGNGNAADDNLDGKFGRNYQRHGDAALASDESVHQWGARVGVPLDEGHQPPRNREYGRMGSRSHLAPVDAVAYRCVPLEKTVPHPRALVRAPLLPSRLHATLPFLKGARQVERHLWCQMRMIRVLGIITAATAELDLAN